MDAGRKLLGAGFTSAVSGAAVLSDGRIALIVDCDAVDFGYRLLVDGAGHPVRLLGVNRAGAEYACVQGWGIFDGPTDTDPVWTMTVTIPGRRPQAWAVPRSRIFSTRWSSTK